MGKYEPILRIAELGNLTRAAETLGYSQSSLSYITGNLEKELGIKLFFRERQGVTMTEAGTALIEIMREIEALERKLRTVAQNYHSGLLRLGILTSISMAWLPEILTIFQERRPETEVHIIQKNTYPELLLSLQQEEVDCTFFVGKHSSGLDFFPLYKDFYYVVVANTHPLAGLSAVRIKDLEQHVFIPPGRASAFSPVSKLYDGLMNTCQVYTHFSEDVAVLPLVRAGFGFSILPGLLLTSLHGSDSVRALPLEPPVYRNIGLLCRPYRDTNSAVRTFLQVARGYIDQWKETHGRPFPGPL